MTPAPLVVSSNLDRLEDVRVWAADGARAAGYDAEAVFALELALTEAVSNIIRHGYHGEDGHEVHLEMAVDPESLTVRITDWGDRFDHDGFVPEDLDHVRTGGYGVQLIHMVMDEVVYAATPDAKGTILTLVRRRDH
jgi:serine/threonine-protein kinase RsbW